MSFVSMGNLPPKPRYFFTSQSLRFSGTTQPSPAKLIPTVAAWEKRRLTFQKAQRWTLYLSGLALLTLAGNFAAFTVDKHYIKEDQRAENNIPMALNFADIKKSFAAFHTSVMKLPTHPTPAQKAALSEKLMAHFQVINEAHREAGITSLNSAMLDFSNVDDDMKKRITTLLKTNSWKTASTDFYRIVEALVRTKRLLPEYGKSFIEADMLLQEKMRAYNKKVQHLKPSDTYAVVRKSALTCLILSLFCMAGLAPFKPVDPNRLKPLF